MSEQCQVNTKETKTYFPSGNIQSILTLGLENNEMDSYFKRFSPDGSIREEYGIKNGKKNGLYKKYYKGKWTLIECNYKNGNIDGKYVSHPYQGQQIQELNYDNGLLVESKTIDHFTRNIVSHCVWKDGVPIKIDLPKDDKNKE